MNDASFCAALLQQPAITALVGNRSSLGQLKQGAALPALVYQVISSNDRPYLAAWQEAVPVVLRLQINPLATSVDGVEAIAAAVRTALEWMHSTTVDGVRVTHIETAGRGPYDKDPETGTWTRSFDYLITAET